MKKYLKKSVVLVLTFVLLFSAFPVRGRCASDEDQIRRQMMKFAGYCRNYKPLKAAGIVAPDKLDKFKFVKFKSVQKLIRKSQKKYFSCEINDISVDGKRARVNISYRYFNNANGTSIALSEYLHSSSKANLEKILRNNIKSAQREKYIDEDDDFMELDMTVHFKKVKGKWMISKVNDDLLDLTDGGVVTTIMDCARSPLRYW